MLLELAAANHAVHELVGEVALAGTIGGDPLFEHGGFEAAHGLHFGDAGVGHAVHVAVEQRLLIVRGEVAVVRHALVEVVRDEVEEILFEVGTGAGDAVHLVLPDHFGKTEAEFGGAHRAGEGHEHLAPGVEMTTVALGRVDEGGGVEVTVVVTDEVADRTAHGSHGLCVYRGNMPHDRLRGKCVKGGWTSAFTRDAWFSGCGRGRPRSGTGVSAGA